MRFERLTPVLLVAAAAVATMLPACSTEECEGNKNSLPLAGFLSSAISPREVSIDSLTVFGVGAPGDSLLLNNRSASELYLPFRIDEGETTFVFRYEQEALRGITDSVTFRYDIVPYFVSSACGVVYNYEIKSIDCTRNLIDSVSCPGMKITNANIRNINIYFRVQTSE